MFDKIFDFIEDVLYGAVDFIKRFACIIVLTIIGIVVWVIGMIFGRV